MTLRLMTSLFSITLAIACSDSHGGGDGGPLDAASDSGRSDSGRSDSSRSDTGTADWGACTLNAECTLEPDGCCAGCPFTDFENLDGVNVMFTAEHRLAVCPETMGCEPCAVDIDPLRIPPHFATCMDDRCTPVDLSATAMTDCAADTDCRVRVRDCCPCGATLTEGNFIAVRGDAEGDFQGMVCDDLACPECEPVYPDTVEAFCDDGTCALRRP
jgi:hypothetical protein